MVLIMTMLPDFCFFICGTTAWVMCMVPNRLMSIALRHSAIDDSEALPQAPWT